MVAPLIASILVTGLSGSVQSNLPQAPPTPVIPAETQAQKDARMAWWRKARFGMFIHWGLYAVPAGTWNGNTGYAEWIREEAHIPVGVYDKFMGQFNPVKFDAKVWAKLAHDAGMRYLVITSKHHDGFNMFDSKYTNFKVTNSAWHHDPMKDLAKAVRAQGMTFCMYHSIMDWNYPDYLPRRSWEAADRPVDGADYNRFVQYLRNDVQQILTDYKPLGVVWFDGNWEGTWTDKLGKELYALCRTVNPHTIINNRVGKGDVGDYSTPEQEIPATGLPGVYWETCMTMNDHWGYNSHDHNYKSVKTIVRNLVNIVSKGGNYLLNIGPRADGTFPPEAVNRLKGIGAWMNVNHESIYDTSASIFDQLPWGRCSVRSGSRRSELYLHIFDWPADGKLLVPGIGNSILSAKILGHGAVQALRSGPNVVVTLPGGAHNEIDTVVKLEVSGKPVVFVSPKIDVTSPGFVSALDVPVTVPGGLTARYTLDGSPVTASSLAYSERIHIERPTTLSVAGFYKGKLVTETVSRSFKQLAPWPAADATPAEPGLDVQEFLGNYNSVRDFGAGTPTRTLTARRIELDPTWPKPPEYIGRTYTGTITAPSTELYKFVLRSDDGSGMWIDGKLVVNNDGLHGAEDATGYAPLAKGPHALKVAWFNKTGDAALNLRWAAGQASLTEVPLRAYHH